MSPILKNSVHEMSPFESVHEKSPTLKNSVHEMSLSTKCLHPSFFLNPRSHRFILLSISKNICSKIHSLTVLHDLHFLKKESFSPNLSLLARADIKCHSLKKGLLCRTFYSVNGLYLPHVLWSPNKRAGGNFSFITWKLRAGWKENLKNLSEHALLLGTSE